MYLLVLNAPKLPVYSKSVKAELKRSVVKVATIQQKNICQDNVTVQNEHTSSIENNSPPTGAPKAEATPAAAPAEIKFLLQKTMSFSSLCLDKLHGKSFPMHAFNDVIFTKARIHP